MAKMSEQVFTGNDTQTPKERSVSELLDNVTEFIDSVYRDILTPTSRPSLNTTNTRSPPPRRSLPISLSPNTDEVEENADTQAEDSNSPEMASITAARSRRNIDADIERINRICDTVDLNLRSIGLHVNIGHGSRNTSNNQERSNRQTIVNITPTFSGDSSVEFTLDTPPNQAPTRRTTGGSPRRVRRADRMPRQRSRVTTNVDLNERLQTSAQQNVSAGSTAVVDDDDDEVVVVSCNLPPVIDLCTPNYELPRRAVVNRNELSRRNLDQSTCDEDFVVPVRRRRVGRTSNDSFGDCETESAGRKSIDGDGGDTSERTPFMCPVCMESCIPRRPTSTKCGHVFCEKCIKQAVRLTHKCPICKTKVNCTQLFRIYV